MKTQHPENITTEQEAKAWLDDLISNDEIFNPDDSPMDIIWNGLPQEDRPNYTEQIQLDRLMDKVCDQGFDVHGYILEKVHPNWQEKYKESQFRTLDEEDLAFVENSMGVFADVVADDSYHYARVLISYHNKLVELGVIK